MSRSRKTSESESELDVTSYIEAVNQFATTTLEVYKSEKNTSFIFSPYSIMAVLGMFYVGTSGKTEKNMKKNLNLPDRITTSKQIAVLIAYLDAIEQANIYLIREDLFGELNSDYVNQIEDNIGSIEKFSAKNPKSVVERVNKIVDTTTHHLIKSIITADMVTPNTSSILLNCIYFKLKWDTPFDKSNTESKPFYDSSSKNRKKIKNVDMMSMSCKKFNYAENDKFQLLEMNYQKNEFSFGVVLPKKTASITPEQEEIDDLISNLRSQKITNLEIPKFRQESKFDIKELLQTSFKLNFNRVEVENMFDSAEPEFGIDQIIHKAVIIVDEEGTEAAAATAMMVRKCMAMRPREEEIINFVADHPFTYYVRYIDTNTFIFNGYFE
jgi:serpin B